MVYIKSKTLKFVNTTLNMKKNYKCMAPPPPQTFTAPGIETVGAISANGSPVQLASSSPNLARPVNCIVQ
ncbi:hypothetical protein ElyMa_001567300 [Elysia marginata]|uniref:Uncharacterized protein n=1 Tax=Elysia marginata TaxID=1093978 RepID=A0AAV4JCC3_9GAST|nr:hypothetical protein ElyMa_001567300 [Elysia marginata]